MTQWTEDDLTYAQRMDIALTLKLIQEMEAAEEPAEGFSEAWWREFLASHLD